MGQRDDLVSVAVGQIGYCEEDNNDTKYGIWYGVNNQPWCDIFVSWCAAQAKVQELIPKCAYVPDRLSYYQNTGAYQTHGSYTPRPGDLCLFDFNNNGVPDHIGIVEKVQDGTLYTIEGNTSSNGESSNGNGVFRKSRSLSSSMILGFGIPAYEDDKTMEIQTIEIKNLDTGQLSTVEGINIQGCNYVKLRDMEKLFPVTIGWDGNNPTMKMNS